MSIDYLLLGATGYIGEAFCQELNRRGCAYKTLSRSDVDYTQYSAIKEALQQINPQFVINCAGYTGKPNVDACETAKSDTILGNIVLVETLANACESCEIPFGHVSSGCIYAGGKITQDGDTRIVTNLMSDDVRPVWESDRSVVTGFAETDVPNFTFDSPPCSFYSGTKAVAEQILGDRPNNFIWRLRIPFDHLDSPRNYLSKLQRYAKIYDNANSFSHRGEFASACLDLWEKRADFGTYNVTNPGWATASDVVRMIQEILKLDKSFEFFAGDDDFYATAAATPRSNAILDHSKLADAGINMRPVEEAIEESLRNWQSQ